MSKKFIIRLLTHAALTLSCIAQTGSQEDTYSAVTNVGGLTVRIIQDFKLHIENRDFDWNRIQATRATVSQWLGAIRKESFLSLLQDFRKFESISLREYSYCDAHPSLHLDIQAYKDTLIQQFLEDYTKLLQHLDSPFWPEATLKKILVQNMIFLVDIRNLASAYQGDHILDKSPTPPILMFLNFLDCTKNNT